MWWLRWQLVNCGSLSFRTGVEIYEGEGRPIHVIFSLITKSDRLRILGDYCVQHCIRLSSRPINLFPVYNNTQHRKCQCISTAPRVICLCDISELVFDTSCSFETYLASGIIGSIYHNQSRSHPIPRFLRTSYLSWVIPTKVTIETKPFVLS